MINISHTGAKNPTGIGKSTTSAIDLTRLCGLAWRII